MIDLGAIRAVSFDCYGTLIDWQRGIEAAVAPLRAGIPAMARGDELFREFARLERQAEMPPYSSYKDVLREVAAGLTGIAGPCEFHEVLWRSVAQWPAFADTAESLRRLKREFGTLAVLSNVDDDLFACSHARLGVRLDVVVTAQQVRSYKPAEANFRALLAALRLEPRQVLHVAESRIHDIEPASKLGFKTAWVQRQAGSSASGDATRDGAKPNFHVRSLRELCDAVGA
ncbi:MAG: haloacid dehalogenase type II [Phycisphaerales bacterium]